MLENFLGTYRVRTIARGERIVRVPRTACGDYQCFETSTGTLKFYPVETARVELEVPCVPGTQAYADGLDDYIYHQRCES